MKNTPLIPYVLIMAFGIGLIFFMSVGSQGQKEVAEGGETTGSEEVAVDISTCVGCHGGDLTGGMGPNLIGADPEHIVDVLVNGIPGTVMTPGLKSEAEAKLIAEHISTLE